MISSGKRVVVFLDAGADGSDGTVDYILPEFEMVRVLIPCAASAVARVVEP